MSSKCRLYRQTFIVLLLLLFFEITTQSCSHTRGRNPRFSEPINNDKRTIGEIEATPQVCNVDNYNPDKPKDHELLSSQTCEQIPYLSSGGNTRKENQKGFEVNLKNELSAESEFRSNQRSLFQNDRNRGYDRQEKNRKRGFNDNYIYESEISNDSELRPSQRGAQTSLFQSGQKHGQYRRGEDRSLVRVKRRIVPAYVNPMYATLLNYNAILNRYNVHINHLHSLIHDLQNLAAVKPRLELPQVNDKGVSVINLPGFLPITQIKSENYTLPSSQNSNSTSSVILNNDNSTLPNSGTDTTFVIINKDNSTTSYSSQTNTASNIMNKDNSSLPNSPTMNSTFVTNKDNSSTPNTQTNTSNNDLNNGNSSTPALQENGSSLPPNDNSTLPNSQSNKDNSSIPNNNFSFQTNTSFTEIDKNNSNTLSYQTNTTLVSSNDNSSFVNSQGNTTLIAMNESNSTLQIQTNSSSSHVQSKDNSTLPNSQTNTSVDTTKDNSPFPISQINNSSFDKSTSPTVQFNDSKTYDNSTKSDSLYTNTSSNVEIKENSTLPTLQTSISSNFKSNNDNILPNSQTNSSFNIIDYSSSPNSQTSTASRVVITNDNSTFTTSQSNYPSSLSKANSSSTVNATTSLPFPINNVTTNLSQDQGSTIIYVTTNPSPFSSNPNGSISKFENLVTTTSAPDFKNPLNETSTTKLDVSSSQNNFQSVTNSPTTINVDNSSYYSSITEKANLNDTESIKEYGNDTIGLNTKPKDAFENVNRSSDDSIIDKTFPEPFYDVNGTALHQDTDDVITTTDYNYDSFEDDGKRTRESEAYESSEESDYLNCTITDLECTEPTTICLSTNKFQSNTTKLYDESCECTTDDIESNESSTIWAFRYEAQYNNTTESNLSESDEDCSECTTDDIAPTESSTILLINDETESNLSESDEDSTECTTIEIVPIKSSTILPIKDVNKYNTTESNLSESGEDCTKCTTVEILPILPVKDETESNLSQSGEDWSECTTDNIAPTESSTVLLLKDNQCNTSESNLDDDDCVECTESTEIDYTTVCSDTATVAEDEVVQLDKKDLEEMRMMMNRLRLMALSFLDLGHLLLDGKPSNPILPKSKQVHRRKYFYPCID